MSVYPQAEVSGTFVVFEDGTVQVPTAGRIPVAGKTPAQTIAIFEEVLGKFFVHPKVSLSIIKYSERNIVIAGEIRIPGIIPYSDGLTITESIARAGGFSLDSDRKSVRIFRGQMDKREVKVVDVDAILTGGGGVKDVPVQMGDLIEVPRLVNAIYVWGEVRAPGRLDYFIGMTLHDVVARAQGVTAVAAKKEVRIFHVDGTMSIVNLDAVLRGDPTKNVLVRPGDIVVIPDITFARVTGRIALLGPWFAMFGFLLEIVILWRVGL